MENKDQIDIKIKKNNIDEAISNFKKNTGEKDFSKPILNDFGVIIEPLITEKTMFLMRKKNQVTFKVKSNANKINIKMAFERLFKVKVIGVSVSNVLPKTTTRGGRYKGTISGYKKAIITLDKKDSIDLFKETENKGN